jgi:hypothetical protein
LGGQSLGIGFLRQIWRLRTRLERSYVFSLRAFFALSDDELNLLTFLQRLETCARDGAVVDKDIRTALLFDKSKAFAVIEPLNSSSCFICHIH